MMAPVVAMVMPMAGAADPARAVVGVDHPAVAVRVIIIGRRVVEMPVKMVPVREPISAVAETAAVENMTAAKAATMEGMTAVKATAMEAASVETTSVEAATVTTAAVTAATMAAAMTTAANFDRPPIKHMSSDWRRTRIDQRQRFCTLVRQRRQHQHRRSREAQRTDQAADRATPGIWNSQHV
jgi:hypothetical protein